MSAILALNEYYKQKTMGWGTRPRPSDLYRGAAWGETS